MTDKEQTLTEDLGTKASNDAMSRLWLAERDFNTEVNNETADLIERGIRPSIAAVKAVENVEFRRQQRPLRKRDSDG